MMECGGKFDVQQKDFNPDLASGRYRATRLWNEIIKHLKENVDVGRKRHLIWIYDDVFTGANAVDVVTNFLEKNKDNFPNEVTRNNAIKVCQTLMDQFVFVPASKSQSSLKFEANHVAFYRFVTFNVDLTKSTKENIFLSPVKRFGESKVMKNHYSSRSPGPYPNPFDVKRKSTTKERRSLDPSALVHEEFRSPLITANNFDNNQNSSSFSRSRGVRRRHSFVTALNEDGKVNPCPQPEACSSKVPNAQQKEVPVNGMINRNNFLAHRSLRLSLHKLKLKAVRNDNLDNEAAKKFNSNGNYLSCNDSVHELALSYLLTLVDIPFIESILNIPSDMPAVRPSTTNDNPTLNPAPELAVLKCNPSLDVMRIPWVSAAVACIGYIPDGLESLWSVQACKLKCYRAVATYHLSFLSSILPEDFLAIYLCVIEGLRKAKVNNALKVITLLIILLPVKRRGQLEKLIRFLKMVSEDLFAIVDKRLNNRECVVRDFSSVILCHPVVGAEQSGQFLDFLLARAPSIFNSVHLALTQSSIGELLSLWNTRFCHPIRNTESERKIFTSKNLVLLANMVRDSQMMTSKEKKQFLKKFQKVYPELCV